MCKKILAILLSCLLLCSCFSFLAFAEDAETVLTNAAETNDFVIVSNDYTVPLRIVPATLTQGGESQEIRLVMILGVKNSVNGKPNKQANNLLNCFLAAFNLPNSYYSLVKETIFNEIPAGSKLVFACHSLGGMVAQQLRTDADLKDAYEIVHTVTCGSPYIMVKNEAEGTFSRLINKNDAIPYMSPATVIAPKKQFGDCYRIDGGYRTDFDAAHTKSYPDPAYWGDYDALGNPGGDATLRFDAAAVATYGEVA